jgi:hypothetical protein
LFGDHDDTNIWKEPTMLTKDTLVQVHKSGASIPVEALSIGDLTYDSFSARYREIIDIKSRTVNLRSHPEFTPVVVQPNAFGVNIPSTRVSVSPQQEFLWLDKSDDAIPVLEPLTARELVFAALQEATNIEKQITYFVLFFDVPCFVICSGLVTFVASPTVFTMPVSQLRRRA